MTVSRETRGIIMRAIEHVSQEPGVIGRGHYDKACWLDRVIAHMNAEQPIAAADASLGCVTEYYAQRIEEYIRTTRDAEIENLRGIEALRRNVRQQQRIVQVHTENGDYLTKRLRDCTAAELDTLARQYEKSAAADSRRATYYRSLAQQMRLFGLAEGLPLSKALDQQA